MPRSLILCLWFGGALFGCGGGTGQSVDAPTEAPTPSALGAALPEATASTPSTDSNSGANGGGTAGERCLRAPIVVVERWRPKPMKPVEQAWIAELEGLLPAARAGRTVRMRIDPNIDQPIDVPGAEAIYAIARIAFEHQDWSTASRLFREVAVEHPSDDTAPFAAQLHLESLNVIAMHAEPARPECDDALAFDIALFLRTLCAPPRAGNEEACASFLKAKAQIDARKSGAAPAGTQPQRLR